MLYSSDMKRRGSVELKAEIEARIAGEPTMVWSPVDFLDLGSRAAVDKALQRLTKDGALSRISRGLYYRARINPLTAKATVPGAQAIIDSIARRDQARMVVDGLTAANDLGLTTAVPAHVIVLTDARLRPITIGRQRICFRAAAPSRLHWAGRPAMRIVQALHWLQDMLESDRPRIVAQLRRILLDPTYGEAMRADLQKGLHTLPTWLHSVAREILDTNPLSSSVRRKASSPRTGRQRSKLSRSVP
jgi:Family of unknown function (DUF6088)